VGGHSHELLICKKDLLLILIIWGSFCVSLIVFKAVLFTSRNFLDLKATLSPSFEHLGVQQ
jgi:hypothetical protein